MRASTWALAATVALGGCSTLPRAMITSGLVGGAAGAGLALAVAPSGDRADHMLISGAVGAVGTALAAYGLATLTGFEPWDRPVADTINDGAYAGVPEYLVVTDTFPDHASAAARASERHAAVVQSDLLADVAPGQFLVVAGEYAMRRTARAAARDLEGVAPDVRVIDARNLRNGPMDRYAFVRVIANVGWPVPVTLRIHTVDGDFTTPAAPRTHVSFWVAHDGEIAITVEPDAGAPPACHGAPPAAIQIPRDLHHNEDLDTMEAAIALAPPAGCAAP
jgi:hypothetical protein